MGAGCGCGQGIEKLWWPGLRSVGVEEAKEEQRGGLSSEVLSLQSFGLTCRPETTNSGLDALQIEN